MRRMKYTTIKVQIPLAGDMSKALIYNQDRSIQTTWPVDDVMGIMQGTKKRYFRATVNDAGVLEILRPSKEQSW